MIASNPEQQSESRQPSHTVQILGFTYVKGPKVAMIHLVVLAVVDWAMRLILGRERPAPTPNLEGKSLAIAKIDLLGDVLMITPLLRELRVQSPGTKLLLVVGSWSLEAARLILDEGLCDSTIVYDPPTMSPARISWFQKIKQWLQTLRTARTELRQHKVDVYLELRSSSPNSLLLARLAGVRHKIGYALRGYSYILQQALPYDGTTPMGQQYLNVLAMLGLQPARYEKPVLHWLGDRESPDWIPSQPDYLVLHPFSRNSRKMIPAAWWEQMLAPIAAGRSILVLGTRGDLEQHELISVLSAAGCDLSAVGRTTFREATTCVRGAAAFIGVDSVFAHVALAFDKPAFVAAVAGASYRLAFPSENPNLFYHEVDLSSFTPDSSASVMQEYRDRITLDLHPAHA